MPTNNHFDQTVNYLPFYHLKIINFLYKLIKKYYAF